MTLDFTRLILVTALGLGGVAAFALAAGEARTVEVEAVAARGGIAAPDTCARGCPSRVRAALARIATDTALRAAVPSARNPDLDAVIAARPFWAKALVERAYWLSVRQPDTPASIAAIADSYRAAPYWHDVALWRVAQVLRGWRHMPAPLRERAVAEAKWYIEVDVPSRQAMSVVIAGSPIEVALLLHAA